MCSAQKPSIANEASFHKSCGSKAANSAAQSPLWSMRYVIAAMCVAYVLCGLTEAPDDTSSCVFECCVVFAAACVHFFFRMLDRNAPGRPKRSDGGSASKRVDEALLQRHSQLQEGLVRAVVETYKSGPCSPSAHATLLSKLSTLLETAGSPEIVTTEMSRTVVDTCLAAHDVHHASDWLKFMCQSGCSPTAGTVYSVLKANVNAGYVDAAEDLITHTLDAIGADSACFQLLFEHCLSCTDATKVNRWLQLVAKRGRQTQIVAWSALVRACVQTGADQAELWMGRAAEAGVEPCLQLYNAMLFVCGRVGDISKAESWLSRMGNLGPCIAPDTASYAAVMDACARHGDHVRAQEWFERMISSGVRCDVFTHHTLIKAYARAGDAYGAEQCIVRAKKRGVQLQAFGYNAVIAAAAKAGNPEMAQQWLHHLLQDGIEPDAMSFNCVIDAWAKHGDAAKAQSVLELMTRGPVRPDVITIGMVLHACAKAGDIDRAEAVFKQVLAEREVTPDAICYNAMIHAYVKAGKISRAEYWLMAMLERNILPSVVSYTTVIHAHARNGNVVQAEGVLKRMLESGIEANVVTFSALIQACSKTGDIERAEKWFQVMRASGVKANDMSFSTMLNVFAKAGDYARAETWLLSMEQDGVTPNTVCYNNVIEACMKAGRLDRAENWLQCLMSHSELAPTRKSYTIAAQGYSKIGRWQDTKRIFDSMEDFGITMDEFSLTVLLSAYNRAKPTQAHRAEEAFRNYAQKGLPVTAPPVRVLRNMLGVSRADRLLEQENVSVIPDT